MPVNTIRVSAGTAAVLGLRPIKMKAPPTTAYLMMYREGRCAANCGFCPQAREARSNLEHLSRISWPHFSLSRVLAAFVRTAETHGLKRVCVQTLNYPRMVPDLLEIVTRLAERASLPISCAITPVSREEFRQLRAAGVDRVGIAFDACTPPLFDEVKGARHGGPYSWEGHETAIRDALAVFGAARVTTHYIVGLGENEVEMAHALHACAQLGVTPSLFAFTPIKGTRLEATPPPALVRYRKLQLVRYLLVVKRLPLERFEVDPADPGVIRRFPIALQELEAIVERGTPFRTTGCPGCNRPYYTSSPLGPTYNYARPLTAAEKAKILDELCPFVREER